MNRSLFKSSLYITTALGFGVTMPAFAQDNASSPGLSDIVVTARRVEERLQDVPISITVFNQQQLSDRNVVTPMDIAIYTPSLSVNSNYGSDMATFAMRGFVQDNGTAPSVGVYFADVVAPRGGTVALPTGDGAGAGSMFDLQNVQVLKGPQGTLQGRNTTGGSVLLVPQKPTSKLEGYVEGSLGNYDMQRLQGVINIPLGDTFRMRLGVDRMSRDGWLINDGQDANGTHIGPDAFNNVNYTALRASFVADLTQNLENYTIVSYSKSNTNGAVGKLIATSGDGTMTIPGVGTFANPNFYEGLAYSQLQAQAGSGFYHVRTDMANPSSRVKQWQIINTTTWSASDTLTVKNIASYAQYTNSTSSPLFATNFTSPNVSGLNSYLASVLALNPQTSAMDYSTIQNFYPGGPSAFQAALAGAANQSMNFAAISPVPGLKTANQYTFTEELQLQGRSANNRLTWQAGAYFESSRPLGLVGNQTQIGTSCTNLAAFQCFDPYGQALSAMGEAAVGYSNYLGGLGFIPGYDPLNPYVAAPVFIGSVNYNAYRNSYRDIGLYSQVSYELTPQWKLTGGFRYTWDRQNTEATLISYRFPSANVAVPYCVRTGLAMTTPGQCTNNYEAKSQKPTWMIDIDYKPSDDILMYAKYSRGYRAGGVKPDAPTAFIVFRPERVDTYEMGLKSSFRGAVRGTFNVTGFYNKFADQQIQIGFNAPQGSGLAPTAGPVNAGKSRMYGVEAEASINPFRGFVLSANYTYLNTKVQQIATINPADAAPYATQPQILPGDELALSPKNKYSITAAYTLPLDEKIGRISLAATFAHTDSQHSTYGDRGVTTLVVANGGIVTQTADLAHLPATNLLNLNLNWNSVAGLPVDLSLFATNVTKQKYYTFVPGLLGGGSGAGFETASVGEPQMYGIRTKVRF